MSCRLENGDSEVLVEASRERRRLLRALETGQTTREEALLRDPSLAVRWWPERGEDVVSDADARDVRAGVLTVVRARRREKEKRRRRNRMAAAAAAVTLSFGILAWQMVPRFWPAEPAAPRAPRMTHSSLERLNRPDARVYEVTAEDFSIILVVDESLEL